MTPEEQVKKWREAHEEDRNYFLTRPPFQSSAQCPKCLQSRDKAVVSYQVWSRVQSVWKADHIQFEIVCAMTDLSDVPYMRVACPCGYSWTELCADASPKGEGDEPLPTTHSSRDPSPTP